MALKKQKILHKPDVEERLVKAAKKLFLKHGYTGVSTDMLAKEAGISKATMYSRFKDKEDILKAVVDGEGKRLYTLDSELPTDSGAFRKAMITFSINLLQLLNDPEIVRFDQLILSQAAKHPKITALFYQHSYVKTYKELEKMIAHGQRHGFIQRTQPAELLADILLNALEGRTYQQAIYGVKASMFKSPQKRVQTVLNIVLDI